MVPLLTQILKSINSKSMQFYETSVFLTIWKLTGVSNSFGLFSREAMHIEWPLSFHTAVQKQKAINDEQQGY